MQKKEKEMFKRSFDWSAILGGDKNLWMFKHGMWKLLRILIKNLSYSWTCDERNIIKEIKMLDGTRLSWNGDVQNIIPLSLRTSLGIK